MWALHGTKQFRWTPEFECCNPGLTTLHNKGLDSDSMEEVRIVYIKSFYKFDFCCALGVD